VQRGREILQGDVDKPLPFADENFDWVALVRRNVWLVARR